MRTSIFTLAAVATIGLLFATSVYAGRGNGHGHGNDNQYPFNPNSPAFKRANVAQLAAISTNPATDLWYQNCTIEAHDPVTGELFVAQNYGYWQKRIYDARTGAFNETQYLYRTATQFAIQQINSYVDGEDDDGDRFPSPQTWTVRWVTNPTAESAAIIGLDIKSFAIGSDIVYVSFTDPTSKSVVFAEQMQAIKSGSRRYYSQTYKVDASGETLPVYIWFDSVVVPQAYQPAAVKAAVQAFEARQVPIRPDPVAPAMNVYLYTQPNVARDVEEQANDPFYVEVAESYWRQEE